MVPGAKPVNASEYATGLAPDPSAVPLVEAQQRVQLLSDVNQLRKAMQSEMIENVMGLAEGQEDFVVVHLESLHEGIVGIVAAKVAEAKGK